MIIKLSVMDDFAWRGVFDFVSPTDERKKVALISQFGDRRFSGICQKWLHKWTENIRIDTLRIYERCGKMRAENGLQEQVELADTELPVNICDFRWIRIEHLDSKVLQFLRRMEPLFHGVNLHVSGLYDEESMEAMRTALRHVLPLLAGGIETVCLNTSQQLLLTMRDHLPAQQFFAIKRLEVMEVIGDDTTTDDVAELLLSWLNTKLADGQPKIVELSHSVYDDISLVLGLIDQIRQHFPNETGQASFFIGVFANTDCLHTIQESTTQNAGTGEQLLFRKPFGSRLRIGRCPSELDGQKWLKEMDNKLTQQHLKARRRITVLYPSLGQMEEASSEEERKDDNVHQPGPSKEPKLE